MAYTIQAIVAKSGVLAEPLPEKLRVVRLLGGIDMLPLSTEAIKFHSISFCPFTDEGETDAPSQLLKLCERLSQRCTLAYIEAEIFGGAGTQAHLMFSEGKAVGPAVVSDHAINEALRVLGVAKGESVDEFEAVGLDQHRDTDQWLS